MSERILSQRYAKSFGNGLSLVFCLLSTVRFECHCYIRGSLGFHVDSAVAGIRIHRSAEECHVILISTAEESKTLVDFQDAMFGAAGSCTYSDATTGTSGCSYRSTVDGDCSGGFSGTSTDSGVACSGCFCIQRTFTFDGQGLSGSDIETA